MPGARKTDLPRATGSTMAICGFAALAMATVLGFSLASNPVKGADAAVTLLSRPPATDAAVISGATPFDAASCTRMAAARP